MTTRPVFVFSTPPTPNGDLHLGHLSGPYLGADAFVRFQRMNGVAAWHLTGSDDYQSYVVECARREGTTPARTAAHYGDEIAATLRLLDIEPDQFTVTSTAPDYADGLRAFFSRLVASGRVTPRADAALFDGETGDYLYEVDVSGRCPACDAAAGGNICEDCGEPNFCADLVAPRSGRSDAPPTTGTATRYSLPLHEFRDDLAAHHDRGRTPERLRELAERLFRRERLDVPVSHPSAWGVPPAEGLGDEQVIWVWPEMSWGFLYGVEALGRQLGRDWRADTPEPDWKIVHFFGYDNSFYHSVLYPALYRLAYPEWECDIDYHVNEFYLLEDAKFSTSRRHAVWGKDFVGPHNVDAVRFFLSRTRPEGRRTSFRHEDYAATVKDVLVGTWQRWLDDLGARVRDTCDGRAPEPRPDTAFRARLDERLAALTDALGGADFSLNRAAETLAGLVEDTVRFREETGGRAVADELSAAWLLARGAAPVMPRFAAGLADALGMPAPDSWPTAADDLPAGTPIDLAGREFLTAPALPAGDEPVLLPWLRELVVSTVALADESGVDTSTLVELGVGSLHAVALQFQVLEQLDVDVTVEELLGERDVTAIARLLEEKATPEAVAEVTEEVLAC
jgi:methionyl-tRNA synthetase